MLWLTVTGPETWFEKFPIANGIRQSPIDIVTSEAQSDPKLKPLTLHYDPSTSLDILNSGHSFQVTFTDDKDQSSECKTSSFTNHKANTNVQDWMMY